MMNADVHGHFNRGAGELMYTPDDPAATTLEAVIEAEGICTGIAKRDAQLRGDFTLHGVTRTVALEVEHFGPVTSHDGDTSVGRLRTSIDRSD